MDTKSLRQKILDLAIRGKLLPQDPNDEPASVLLERIRIEKQQMVKDGKLKAKDIKGDSIIFKGENNLHYEYMDDGTIKCIENEIPFDVPESWAWSRLGSICMPLQYGTSRKSDKAGKIPVIRMGNLQSGEIDYSDLAYSSDKEDIEKYCLNKNELLFNRTNSPELVGKTALYRGDFPAIFAGYLVRIVPIIVSPLLLNYIMNSDYEKVYCAAVKTDGVNQSNVNAQKIACLIIPIPPQNEQRAISAAVSLALAQIDTIDQDKSHLQLFITQAKSKILDLAIRGKLVPQDPADEPASVLLERIRAEKEQLIKEGKIKRDNNESYIFRGDDKSYYKKIGDSVRNIDDEIPFDVPVTWGFVRLDSAMPYEQPQPYIVTSTEYDASYPTPVLTAGKSFIIGYTNETDGIKTDLPAVIFDDFTTDSKYVDFPFKVKSSAMKILTADSSFADIKFYYYVMQQIECNHSTHKRYWISDFSQKIVPLPPLQEQKRIVAAIEVMEQQLATIMESLN